MDWQRLRKSPNIAIVGSTSLLGKELQEMLENRGRSIGRLTLLETEEYAGLLQEFAGEIQITQVISPDAFDDVDIAFFTCSPEIMQSYVASGAKFPDLTIDLTQAGREGMVVLWGRGGADRTPHDISAARALKGTLLCEPAPGSDRHRASFIGASQEVCRELRGDNSSSAGIRTRQSGSG